MFNQLLAPMHSTEKKRVMECIGTLGLKVTPASVATKASMPIAVATRQLNQIAAETGAHLDVDQTGAIVYRFDYGFESTYAFNFSKKMLHTNGKFLLNLCRFILRLTANIIMLATKFTMVALWFLFRFSFACLLVLSFVFLIVLLIASIFGDSGGDGGGGGVDFGGMDLGNALDPGFGNVDWSCNWHWNWWIGDSYGYGYRPYTTFDLIPEYYTDGGRLPESSIAGPASSFLTDCFSILFGDCDPNQDLFVKQMQRIGSIIQTNGGVIIADQLSPVTGKDCAHNEDWMLPILAHFDGYPEVTETGTIIYIFPAFFWADSFGTLQGSLANAGKESNQLQKLYLNHVARKGTAQKASATVSKGYLGEQTWSFTQAPSSSCWWALTLATFNLAASNYLWNYASHHAQWHGLMLPIGAMLIYAIFCFVVPIGRALFLLGVNAKIERRNGDRRILAQNIERPDQRLQEKLEEARVVRFSQQHKELETTVYSTERDLLEQSFSTSQ